MIVDNHKRGSNPTFRDFMKTAFRAGLLNSKDLSGIKFHYGKEGRNLVFHEVDKHDFQRVDWFERLIVRYSMPTQYGRTSLQGDPIKGIFVGREITKITQNRKGKIDVYLSRPYY